MIWPADNDLAYGYARMVNFRGSIVLSAIAALTACTGPVPTPSNPLDFGILIDDAGPFDSGPPRDVGPDTGVSDDAAPDSGVPDTGREDATGEDVEVGPDTGFVPMSYTSTAIDDQNSDGQAVSTLDIDGDGDRDILSAWSFTDAITIHLNTPAGFQPVYVAPQGTLVAMDAEVGDFDGDGDLDIVGLDLFERAEGFGSPGQVIWFENPGNPAGTWTPHEITNQDQWAPRFAAVADLTGDDLPDIIVGSEQVFDGDGNLQGGEIVWFRNTGGAFVGPLAIAPAFGVVREVAAADIDRNGVIDIVAVSFSENEIAWFENGRLPGSEDQSPTFTEHLIRSVEGPAGLALANIDADADLEILTATDDGLAPELISLDPPPNPRATWPQRLLAPSFGTGNLVRLRTADLDNDGRDDLVASSIIDAEIRAYFSEPQNSWRRVVVETQLVGINDANAGDLDGDGIPEIVGITYGTAMDTLSIFSAEP